MGNKLVTLFKFISDPDQRFLILHNKGMLKGMDDRRYLKKLWKINMGYEIDLDHPQTFNEKIQWLKLNDRNPAYHMLVDKVTVKEWVAERIGEKYIIPTLGVWDDPEKVDFDGLPDRFVLKCNHNSGLGMCICEDKAALDIAQTKRKLMEGFTQDYFSEYREWAYRDVPHRILAEEYIESSDEDGRVHGLIDLKVHCFNGEPDFIEVIGNRDYSLGTAESDNYDFEWHKLDWRFGDYPAFSEPVSRPDNLRELRDVCRELSKQMRYARVDFYNVDGSLKFGEITLYPNAGMVFYNKDYTPELDRMLGDKIDTD